MDSCAMTLTDVLRRVVAVIDEYRAEFGDDIQEVALRNVIGEVYDLAAPSLVSSEEEIAENSDAIQGIRSFLIQHILYIRKHITKFYMQNRIVDCVLKFTPGAMEQAKEYSALIDRSEGTRDYGKISVIIPVYNVEAFLPKCLDSVLSQTYKNLEIIAVDDGSPDGCGAICDMYAKMDRRLKVIHQKNGGLCNARNRGLRESTGDFIGFVDSDDWCAPDMFEYLAEGLVNYEAEVSVCRYYRVRGKTITNKANGETVVFDTHQKMLDDFINRFVIRSTFWNKLFRKELFEGKKFPEGRTYEGTYFMHELLEPVNRLVLLGEAKYYYIDNEDSIVRTRSLTNGMNYVYAYIKRYNDLNEANPHLSDKLFDDVIDAIRSLTYIGYKATEADIAAKMEDIQVMCAFIEEHKERMKPLSKHIQKEIHALGEGTLQGFIKARRLRRGINGVKKLYRIVTRRKLREKTKTAVVKPKRQVTHMDISELSAEERGMLKKLQAEITEIIDVIDRICSKYNLRYYIYGGTLLGAARHTGFIPWDDDADLVMPRDDYEKFAKVCQQELGDKYYYMNCFTDPEFHMLFAKVCKNGTYVHEAKWANKNLNKGIFVDILPLDYFPKNKLMGSIVLRSVSLLHQICAFKRVKSRNPITKILFKIGKKLPRNFIYRMRDFVLKASNKLSKKENICSMGSHYQPVIRRVFKADWFLGEEKRMEFEGRMFRVPTNWEKYILHLFGPSYMQLPPKDLQVCHCDLSRINFNGDTPSEKSYSVKYYE